jgi:glycosyltransferase involved in cell wall biosynthesis
MIRRLALLPWGTPFEKYLHPLGMSVEEFRSSVTGGWLFNYVRALGAAGIESTIVVVSATERRTRFSTHPATGAGFVVVPASWPLRVYQRRETVQATHRQTGAAGARQEGTREAGARRRSFGMPADVAHYAGRYAAVPARSILAAVRAAGCTGILCQEYEDARFDRIVRHSARHGLPAFATFQGGEPPTAPLEAAVRRRSVRRSAGLIVGASAEARRVRAAYQLPDEAAAEIPNPLDVAEIPALDRFRARQELGIPGDTLLVAWHGRVSMRTKGLDVLVSAWRQLLEAQGGDRVRLLLVGSGGDDAELRREIAAELHAGQIIWVDRYMRDRAEMFRYLSAADVYAFPSRHEGFPVAPLEAMACRLPVVAAAANGVPDIFPGGEGDGGLVVPIGDTMALSRGLDMLLQDLPRCRSMGEAGRRRIEDHFSVDSVGRRLGSWFTERGYAGGARQ